MSLPETVTVRVVPLGEANLQSVAGLVNRAFGVYSDLFKGQRTSAEDYALEAGEDARVILVEEGGARLLATSMVGKADRFATTALVAPAGTPRPGSGAPPDADHPWAGAFYYGLAGVEPGVMKRGLGTIMIAEAERMAAAEGFRRLALGTVREFRLVEYYERFGYSVVHEEEYPAGHWDFVAPHHYCEMLKCL